jgi:hypothetical protein
LKYDQKRQKIPQLFDFRILFNRLYKSLIYKYYFDGRGQNPNPVLRGLRHNLVEEYPSMPFDQNPSPVLRGLRQPL